MAYNAKCWPKCAIANVITTWSVILVCCYVLAVGSLSDGRGLCVRSAMERSWDMPCPPMLHSAAAPSEWKPTGRDSVFLCQGGWHWPSAGFTCCNCTEERNGAWFSKKIKPWFCLLLKNQTSSISEKDLDISCEDLLNFPWQFTTFNWLKR